MIILDFETRSRCDLKRRGGRIYAADATTEPLCCVLYDTDAETVRAWLPDQPCPVPPGAVCAAHNADGFDRHVAAALGWRVGAWVDTAHLARRAGLPGALDALGTRWTGTPKDKAGSAFTIGLSRPSRAKARLGQLPDLTPDVLARVVAYCASDVEILAHGWPRLEPWLDVDADTLAADRAINDRGIAFDGPLARRLLELDAANAEREIARVAGVLGETPADVRAAASSPAKFCAYTGATDAQAETVELIAAGDDERAALAQARRAIASIAAGKLRAGLARVSLDGRLRDNHRYYGAHTGRWSGSGMQLQNLPRPAKSHEAWVDAEILAAMSAPTADAATIAVLLRACLHSPAGRTLIVRDFAGVEARGLAWCAGDVDALAVFASGRDPYRTAAAPMFRTTYDAVTKVQRTAGKMAELACGYGGGEGALLRIAAKSRFDFASAGVEPGAVVSAWRAQHAPIVAFWKALEAGFRSALEGHPADVGRWFQFVPALGGVALYLPSGRPIVYNDAGARPDPRGRGTALHYRGTRGVEHVYGGKLAENAISGMCRDLLAGALVAAESAGLRPVLHVHDEIVCEVDAAHAKEASRELERIMHDLPEWARGFPIASAGHEGTRYRK